MGYREEVLADSPVAYWRFGETSGTNANDETSNNHDATYENSYTLGITGPITSAGASNKGIAVSTSGANGQVRILGASAGALGTLGDTLTLECWYKRAGTTTDDILFMKQSGGSSGYTLHIDSVTDKVEFERGGNNAAISTITITDTNWHHIVAVKNGATVKIYIDGVDRTSVVSTTAFTDNTSADLIMAQGDGSADEFAVYATELSQARVQAHYQAATGVPPVANYSEIHTFNDYTFTDTSTDSDGTIVSRLWDFDDGSTSTLTNPTHTFETSGTYDVSLTVTDSQGLIDTETKSLVVEAPPLDASFFATGEDLVVTFTDTSTDPDATITAWDWDFGDTTGSTLQNPVHTYLAPGTYTVTLTVTNSLSQTDIEDQVMTVGDEVSYLVEHDDLPNLPDLAWGTGYSYRSVFRDVDGLIGPYSPLTQFKTDTAPYAPSKLAPADGLATPSNKLLCVVSDPDVDDVIETVTYEIIDVATETLVTGYPKTATGPFPNGSVVSFDTTTDLTLTHTYRWRAKCSDGTLESAWSPWVQFKYTSVPVAHMLAPLTGLINSVPSPSAEYIDAYVLEGTDTDSQLVRALEEGPAFGDRVYELTKSGADGTAIVALDPTLSFAVTDDHAFIAVYARTVSGDMSAKLYLECFDNNGDLLDTLSPNTHTDGFDMAANTELDLTWHQYGMFTDALAVGTVTVRPVVEFTSASIGIAQVDGFQVMFLEDVPVASARMWFNYFDGDFVGYAPNTYSWATLPGQSPSTGVNVLSDREPTVYFNYEGLAVKQSDRLYIQEWSGTKWVQIYDSNWTVSDRTAIPIPSGKLKNEAAYRLKVALLDDDDVPNETAWLPFEVRLLGPTEVIVTTVGQDPDTATLNIAWEPSQLAELEFIAYEVAVETARFGEKRVARITDPATTDYVYPYPISGLQHTIKVRQVKAEAGDELASRWSGGLLSVEYDKWFIKDMDNPTASYLAFDVISGDEPSIGHQANKTAFRPQGRRLPVHYLGEERSRTGSLTVRIGYVEDADTQLIKLEDLVEARRVCILGLNPSHKVFAMLDDPSEKLTDRPWLVAFDVPWSETEYEEDVFLREGR